jgi:hypothetical protein
MERWLTINIALHFIILMQNLYREPMMFYNFLIKMFKVEGCLWLFRGNGFRG